eukprot:gnl/MRDRNA2_/MRDRNA2_92351_c0_seq1.p1 gnl/MRDRNA2_/MRDRNA2_92351_c0~~gnl/MRDRNA2_/MRDRNA2_92351_c0_seq1.p1  ORF type:complete len:298 (-),score=58.99 gnl/MRDRNA2_/MRDRNA2_92351_c0_seq1:85-978(-)
MPPSKRKAVAEQENVTPMKQKKSTKGSVKGSFLVDVKLISGNTLATLTATESWTGAHVKKALKKDNWLKPETQVSKLMQENGSIISDSQRLTNATLGRSGSVTAIICSNPKLHVLRPCSAADFFNALPYDIVGDEEEVQTSWNLCRSDVMHCNMETAPDDGQHIIKLLLEADPNVDGHGNSSFLAFYGDDLAYGRVVVISNPGPDLQKACCQALGVKLRGVSTDVVEFNWSTDEFGDDEELPDGYLAVLKVLRNNLSRYFRFVAHRSNCRQVVEQMLLLGGYASENCIVGVVHKEAM